MISNLLGKKKKKKLVAKQKKTKTTKFLTKPIKELQQQATVSAQRFNEMIDYYTHELESRLKEIEELKSQNKAIMNTALKQSEHTSQIEKQLEKIKRENFFLKKKLEGKERK